MIYTATDAELSDLREERSTVEGLIELGDRLIELIREQREDLERRHHELEAKIDDITPDIFESMGLPTIPPFPSIR